MNTTNTTLPLLSEVISSPSAFDSLDNYCGDIPTPEWHKVLTRSRDSDLLTESNWECALQRLGGEGEDVEIHRFGHWACGWWEALAVRANTPAYEEAVKIVDELNDYPCLDESDYSEKESEEAHRIWSDCFNTRDRIKYIRDNKDEFNFNGFSDIRAQVKGEYFTGDDSHLIGY